MVHVAVRDSRPAGARPADPFPAPRHPVVVAARSVDPTAAPGRRPARRGVDVVGVHQHAVHPDRRVRRGRLRGRRVGRRRRWRRSSGRESSSSCRSPRSATGSGDAASSWRSPSRRRSSVRWVRWRRSFGLLVASQTLGRPLGLALDFMIAVVATEEMPAELPGVCGQRAGDGERARRRVAVVALPLADLSESSWRLVYLVALVWIVVAVDIVRRLPGNPSLRAAARRRPAARPATVRGAGRDRAPLGNLFIAPASLFQNGYLEDERGFRRR